MKIYGSDTDLILHFGLGLLGRPLSRMIIRQKGMKLLNKYKIQWNSSKSLDQTLTEAFGCVEELYCQKVQRMHIIWTAGKAGFLASSDETAKEFSIYEHILKTISNWSVEVSNERYFYLLSSAGGLYEGKSCIDSHTKIQPSRPYGELKAKQEKSAQDILEGFTGIGLYRTSSVFSLNSDFGRRGLINTIIKNTQMQRPTTIIGHPSTLRDYILDEDIARILIEDIFERNKTGVHTHLLASGRPISIIEIINLISQYMNRVPRLIYSFNKSNSENITFRPSSLRNTGSSKEIGYLIRRALMTAQS